MVVLPHRNCRFVFSGFDDGVSSNIGDRHHDQIAVPDLRWGKLTHLWNVSSGWRGAILWIEDAVPEWGHQLGKCFRDVSVNCKPVAVECIGALLRNWRKGERRNSDFWNENDSRLRIIDEGTDIVLFLFTNAPIATFIGVVCILVGGILVGANRYNEVETRVWVEIRRVDIKSLHLNLCHNRCQSTFLSTTAFSHCCILESSL